MSRAGTPRLLVLHRALVSRRGGGTDAPETVVFFEHDCAERGAPARLVRLAALAWCCEPSDIDFSLLHTEAEVVADSELPASAGDARLLQLGHFRGPLFVNPWRCLMYVRPATVLRLRAAWQTAAPFIAAQHAAAARAVPSYAAFANTLPGGF